LGGWVCVWRGGGGVEGVKCLKLKMTDTIQSVHHETNFYIYEP
jgi:hypothetical protein